MTINDEHDLRFSNPTAVYPDEHSMGSRLVDYVLPKVPTGMLVEAGGRAHVYASQSLQLLLSAGKHGRKQFNWRRPYFVLRDDGLHCVTAPGKDYARHYAHLLATAAVILGLTPHVQLDLPYDWDVVSFADRWLPHDLPQADVIILGYVDRLFVDEAIPWQKGNAFGWKQIKLSGKRVMLLGCEYSYWGDIGGALVEVIGMRGSAPWVVYVGKLGCFDPSITPNTMLASGSSSTVEGSLVTWRTRLSMNISGRDDVLLDQMHLTVPSVVEETRDWYQRNQDAFDVVDPEIGRMGAASWRQQIDFDYLHIVSDNLSGQYHEGLFHEGLESIRTRRFRLLQAAENIIRRVIVQL